jgi:signal transduction histidine kinase
MADHQVKQKWRPPLSWIVTAVLLAILTLPIAVIIGSRAIAQTTSQMGMVEVAALVVALCITVIVALVFSRTITGPINALVRTTEAIRRGQAPVPPPAQHGTREIAILSQSFLDLAARLVERNAYVHSFAQHVSHELKSPLTAIRGSAELLLDETIPAEDRRRFAQNIIADSDRLGALLDRLRTLARADVPLEGKGVTLRRAMELLQLRFPQLQIELGGEVDVPMALTEEASLVVLTQLASNATEHKATTLTVRGTTEGALLRVELGDDGTGISAGNRERIFEPFFTTRREDGGTGMGLGIARSMLEAHGGSISLAESRARGAAFTLQVPLEV